MFSKGKEIREIWDAIREKTNLDTLDRLRVR